MGSPEQNPSLQYHPDSRPVELRTDLRKSAVSALVGECAVSFDLEVIPTGLQQLIPVIQQERDIHVHKAATHGVVSLLYVLNHIEQDRGKFNSVAEQVITSLYHARSSMTHTQEAIERVQTLLGYPYKPYMP